VLLLVVFLERARERRSALAKGARNAAKGINVGGLRDRIQLPLLGRCVLLAEPFAQGVRRGGFLDEFGYPKVSDLPAAVVEKDVERLEVSVYKLRDLGESFGDVRQNLEDSCKRYVWCCWEKILKALLGSGHYHEVLPGGGIKPAIVDRNYVGEGLANEHIRDSHFSGGSGGRGDYEPLDCDDGVVVPSAKEDLPHSTRLAERGCRVIFPFVELKPDVVGCH
jgi:hypothetical protein